MNEWHCFLPQKPACSATQIVPGTNSSPLGLLFSSPPLLSGSHRPRHFPSRMLLPLHSARGPSEQRCLCACGCLQSSTSPSPPPVWDTRCPVTISHLPPASVDPGTWPGVTVHPEYPLAKIRHRGSERQAYRGMPPPPLSVPASGSTPNPRQASPARATMMDAFLRAA